MEIGGMFGDEDIIEEKVSGGLFGKEENKNPP